LDQVKPIIESPDRQFFIMKLDAEKAYLSMVQGSSEFALPYVQAYGLEPAYSIPLHRVMEYLHLARALSISGQLDDALYLTDRLYRIVDMEDRQRSFFRNSAAVSLPYVKKLLHMMDMLMDGTQTVGSLLTEQETRILKLIKQGLSNMEVAIQTQVTMETIKTHIKNIYLPT
jgi:hypothetical protein